MIHHRVFNLLTEPTPFTIISVLFAFVVWAFAIAIAVLAVGGL